MKNNSAPRTRFIKRKIGHFLKLKPNSAQFFHIPYNSRTDRIKMDISHQLQEIDIFLAQDGFETVLEQVSVTPVPSVIPNRIAGQKPPHNCRDPHRSHRSPPHHDVVQGYSSIYPRSPWHEPPIPTPLPNLKLISPRTFTFLKKRTFTGKGVSFQKRNLIPHFQCYRKQYKSWFDVYRSL